MHAQTLPTVMVLATVLALPAGAADWLQFRGPGGLGAAPDKDLPTTWSSTENVVWKAELPGAGASSPIVVGKKIFISCYSGYGLPEQTGQDMKNLTRHLVCIDRDSGKILWARDLPAALPDQRYGGYQALHGYASSTPVSDGNQVYVFFGKAGVFAFDLDGKERWQASAGTGTHGWGSGTSPVLYKDLLIVNASVESGSLLAFNKKDGKTVWTAKGIASSWSTPLVVDVDGQQELVVNSQGRLRAFNPDSGEEVWSCQGMRNYVCPSLIAHDGVIYAIGDRFSNTTLAVRAGGKGDVTGTHVLWRLDKAATVSSPVYHDGHLYWAHDERGIVYCVDAKEGKVVYQERLRSNPDPIYASALLADGKIYYVSRTRGTFVVEAKPAFHLLAHNTFSDDRSVFNASPAVNEGRLLLRSDRYLYCIGNKR